MLGIEQSPCFKYDTEVYNVAYASNMLCKYVLFILLVERYLQCVEYHVNILIVYVCNTIFFSLVAATKKYPFLWLDRFVLKRIVFLSNYSNSVCFVYSCHSTSCIHKGNVYYVNQLIEKMKNSR